MAKILSEREFAEHHLAMQILDFNNLSPDSFDGTADGYGAYLSQAHASMLCIGHLAVFIANCIVQESETDGYEKGSELIRRAGKEAGFIIEAIYSKDGEFEL